jgi:hypothetical protein
LRLANTRSDFHPLNWDAATSSIIVTLPDLSVPVVVAFGVGVKIPDGKIGFGFAFPSLRLSASGILFCFFMCCTLI